ncbi:protein O-mannosyl-transferase TMTC1-like [Anguilla rostrata]|uniref:protein O-mannosyl-transferase TMTC1-like n=1 Tax=Anguilla rostrata TaxID=7938 RepID=UPI0030CD6E60
MTAHSREKLSPPLCFSVLFGPGRGVFCYAVLVLVCVLCYSNSIRGEFVHDDVWAILNNPDVRPGSSLRNIFFNDFWGKRMADNTSHKSYRPLCILTFKLNIALAGMTALHFHVVNVCLHCAVSSLLMYVCERCVFDDSRLAFLSSLLFAVHPIHTEAVSGIVGRADVLACMLFLLAFLSYIRSVGEGYSGESAPPTVSSWSLLLSLLLGTCAMLVKETGITVFGVCVLYDGLVLSHKPLTLLLMGGRARDLPKLFGPFARRSCVVSLYVAVIMSFRIWVMGGSMPLFSEQDNPASFCPHLLTRFLTYLYLLAFNAGLLLAPITLCYDWQVGSIPLVESLWDVRNIATLLLGVVMICLCLYCLTNLQGSQKREVLVGLLFLVFPFIPASNLFFRVGFVVAERILYMPSMGYCILVVQGMNRLCSLIGRWGSTALTVSMLLLLLLFSWKTVQQNEVWLSREALFRSGIQTLPHNAKVHYNYANFLKDQGRNAEAIHHYKTALRLYPQHASAMNNLGTLTHHAEEAEEHYRRALETNPQHNRALFNLGNLLKSQGKEEEAERLLRDSILFGRHFADAYSSLASLFAEQKRFAEANDIYLQGIENCPDSSDLHNNYGVFLVDTGDSERAAVHYQNAVRLKPTHYVAMVNLGRLLRSSTENKEAESWYKRALQVVRKVEILTPLGALYYNTGRYEEALQVYREAAALQPDSANIWLALAQVLAMAGRTKEAEKMTFGILSKNAGCIECHRLLSAIYSKRGNHNEALQALEKALQLTPSDEAVLAELHFSKGNQLREMNLLDHAFQSYRLAVELNPDQSQAWMNMGGIQHMKGDYPSARLYYQQALQLSPGSKLLKENLAKLDRLERRRGGKEGRGGTRAGGGMRGAHWGSEAMGVVSAT